jgi:hypothetical protein
VLAAGQKLGALIHFGMSNLISTINATHGVRIFLHATSPTAILGLYHTDCIYFLEKKYIIVFFYQLNLEKIGKN